MTVNAPYTALSVADEAMQIIEQAAFADTPAYQLRNPMRELRKRVEEEIQGITMPRFRYLGEEDIVLLGVGKIKPGQSLRVPPHLAEHVIAHPSFKPLIPLKPKTGTMRVICPYTKLASATRKALELYAPQVEFVDVSKSEDAMWQLWSDVWKERRDTMWVEHDIVIHKDVVSGFANCPELWCTFGYPYAFGTGNPYHGTGCVRFRGELMAEFPDLWDIVATRTTTLHPRKHWCSLDGFSQLALWAEEYHGHAHHPSCKHLDPRNSHGCLGNL